MFLCFPFCCVLLCPQVCAARCGLRTPSLPSAESRQPRRACCLPCSHPGRVLCCGPALPCPALHLGWGRGLVCLVALARPRLQGLGAAGRSARRLQRCPVPMSCRCSAPSRPVPSGALSPLRCRVIAAAAGRSARLASHAHPSRSALFVSLALL